jgi:hypothetical protein
MFEHNPKAHRKSQTVLRIHGSLLILATMALTMASGLGYLSGSGQFGMLHAEPIGYIGLFQAYLLMTTLGVALWLASTVVNTRPWHLIGILGHAAPLAANFLFWRDIEHYGITHAGIAIHVSMIALECVGLWLSRRPLAPSAGALPQPA